MRNAVTLDKFTDAFQIRKIALRNKQRNAKILDQRTNRQTMTSNNLRTLRERTSIRKSPNFSLKGPKNRTERNPKKEGKDTKDQ